MTTTAGGADPAPDLTRPLVRWLSAHDIPRRVVLLCQDAVLPGGERHSLMIRVPGCLAEASIALPAQLLAGGVAEVAVLPCPSDGAAVRDRLAQWRRVILAGLELLDDAPPLGRWQRSPEELVLGQVPVPRRMLLGLGGRPDFPLDPADDETGRTLAALALLQQRGQAAPQPVATGDAEPVAEPDENSPAHKLVVAGCTACGVCVQACPHDALQLSHTDRASTLSQARDTCRGELACVRLCPVAAITDAGGLTLQELWREPRAVLATVATATCPRCRTRHPGPAGSLCPTCDFRSHHAFGSALPPGANLRG
ncbi:MAG: 4Fe-4S binding protein [Propionicimonas sp.]